MVFYKQSVGPTERVGAGVEEFGNDIQFVKNCNSLDTSALAPKGRRGGLPTLREYRRTLRFKYLVIEFRILPYCI